MNAIESCEHFERLASTTLDLGLEHAEQVELLDHVVRCRDCREFYREARALDGLVAAVHPGGCGTGAAEESLPMEIWESIEQRAGDPTGRRLPRVSTWIGWAAAFAIVALGLGIAFQGLRLAGVAAPDEIDVQIGSDRGLMSDDRFVGLTSEILRAEPRYRSAMLQILERVERDTGGMEASIDDPAGRLEDNETTESGLRGRIPA